MNDELRKEIEQLRREKTKALKQSRPTRSPESTNRKSRPQMLAQKKRMQLGPVRD
jgi:hypothetical protein